MALIVRSINYYNRAAVIALLTHIWFVLREVVIRRRKAVLLLNVDLSRIDTTAV